MNPTMTITKLDAAKKQLETAIRLYFNDADSISIHTLACAAHEVLCSINKKRGNHPTIMSDHLIKEPHKKMFREMLNEAKNFFKHADKDPDAVVEFNPETNEYYLLDACETYEILTGEKYPHFIIFRGWFCSKYSHILSSSAGPIVKNKYGNNKMEFYSQMLSVSSGLT